VAPIVPPAQRAATPGCLTSNREKSPEVVLSCDLRVPDMPQTMSGSGDKVRAHRERLRRRGLRPIQIWVPDVNAPSFRREARRQSQLVGTSAHDADDQAFVDAVSEWPPR